jgi:hypothetical protein
MDLERNWDDQRIKDDRLAQLQHAMSLHNVGALYLTEQSTHGRYVLNLRVPGGAVFVPVQGEAIAIVRRRDIGYVQAQHPNVRPPFESHGSSSKGSDRNEGGETALLGEGIWERPADARTSG